MARSHPPSCYDDAAGYDDDDDDDDDFSQEEDPKAPPRPTYQEEACESSANGNRFTMSVGSIDRVSVFPLFSRLLLSAFAHVLASVLRRTCALIFLLWNCHPPLLPLRCIFEIIGGSAIG